MLSEKIKIFKSQIKPYENDLVIAFIIICVALISFGLGRLSSLEDKKIPITIEGAPASAQLSDAKHPTTRDMAEINNKLFVASKKGTKFHYPWCPGAQRIKESNKVWFDSEEQARKAGYSPAANCKGLK
jgi:hypothetical protein